MSSVKKSSLNVPIRRAALVSLVAIIALLANLTRVQVFMDDAYAKNPLNRRQYLDQQLIARGQISAGGLPLAVSTADAEGHYHRSYPTDPAVYEPVVGYLSEQYGASSLEQNYNSILSGTDSSLTVRHFWDRLSGRTTGGASITLTIVPEVQEAAYTALNQSNYEGAVVAIRPSTGEILAMASTPSFDQNALIGDDVTSSAETAENTWATITADERSPLLNHATQDALPPGSIFKIVTTTAALRNGADASTAVTGAARITLPGTTTEVENYGGQTCSGGGTVTLETAFRLSCNTAFVDLGTKMSADDLEKAAEAYGFGTHYDLGVDSVESSLGDLSDPAARGMSAIGQRSVQITVLDAAIMAATVANNGTRMEPYLVSEITRSDLSPLETHTPKELSHDLESDVASQLKELMKASEKSTSGYSGEDIASKTGTAEHGEDSRDSIPHTWYVAFGPTDTADVAVAVVVKNGGNLGAGATGGAVAAPIGRAVIDAALKVSTK